jgi:hypothetical protein
MHACAQKAGAGEREGDAANATVNNRQHTTPMGNQVHALALYVRRESGAKMSRKVLNLGQGKTLWASLSTPLTTDLLDKLSVKYM